ncbi:MAG: hypothetical protein EOO59_07540, partial [Hymenobacter sp.]
MRSFKGWVPAAGQPTGKCRGWLGQLPTTYRLLLLGALLGGWLGGPPAWAQASQPGPQVRVSGTVSDARTGRPLPGAARCGHRSR